MNPLDFFKNEFDKAKDELILKIHVELLQEDVKLALSRLMTLDAQNANLYGEFVRRMP